MRNCVVCGNPVTGEICEVDGWNTGQEPADPSIVDADVTIKQGETRKRKVAVK